MLCGGLQKKREREKKAAIMGELEELLEIYQLPGARGKRKMSQADNAIAVLTDAVEIVRKERKKCGLPDLAPRNTYPPAARSRGQDYSTVKEKSDAVLASLPPPKIPPQSGGPAQGKREATTALAADHRRAMLSSTTLGVMLVRVQDMVITEVSSSLDLLCPGTREGWFRGYKEQQLSLMVFSEDRPVVDRILAGALRGSLEVGLTQSCRLLRVNNDEFGSGCLLCIWVEVSLRVASVLPNSSAVLLTFDMTDEMRKPLTTSADFWRRYYAKGSGVPDTVSHLFLPEVDDPGWLLPRTAQRQDSTSQSSVADASSALDFSRTLSALGVSFLRDKTMSLAKSRAGIIGYVDKDSDTSRVPRFMFVPHTPMNMLEKFTLSEDASRKSFMIPFLNIRPDGTSQPVKIRAAGSKALLRVMMAISIDDGGEHGITCLMTNDGRPQAGCTYHIAGVFGGLFHMNKLKYFCNFGASGWLSAKMKPEPGPVPGGKSTYDLYADSDMGLSDFLPHV